MTRRVWPTLFQCPNLQARINTVRQSPSRHLAIDQSISAARDTIPHCTGTMMISSLTRAGLTGYHHGPCEKWSRTPSLFITGFGRLTPASTAAGASNAAPDDDHTCDPVAPNTGPLDGPLLWHLQDLLIGACHDPALLSVRALWLSE